LFEREVIFWLGYNNIAVICDIVIIKNVFQFYEYMVFFSGIATVQINTDQITVQINTDQITVQINTDQITDQMNTYQMNTDQITVQMNTDQININNGSDI